MEKDINRLKVVLVEKKRTRWFLIGKHDGGIYLSNFAIDRIEDVSETSKQFEEPSRDIDFKEYFADVVGVSLSDVPVQNVVLKVCDRLLGYVVTKPLHESQCATPMPLEDGYWKITLKVQDNYELRSLLLSFGDQIEVLAPENLRNEMKDNAEKMYKLYLSKED